MAYDIGEKYKVLQMRTDSTASILSQSIGVNLQDINRVSILCGLEQNVATPTSAIKLAHATVAAAATVTVKVGPSTDPASAVLTGATLVLGQATLGQLTGWDAVIFGCGSVAGLTTGRSIVIDGTTFTLQKNGSVADYHLAASNCTAFIASLDSALSRFLPHLETFDAATAGAEGFKVGVKRKYEGPAFDVSVTVNTSSTNQICITGYKQAGVIEFTAADVVATNSSYTHFSVQIDSSVTADKYVSAIAVLETGQNVVTKQRVKI